MNARLKWLIWPFLAEKVRFNIYSYINYSYLYTGIANHYILDVVRSAVSFILRLTVILSLSFLTLLISTSNEP